MPWEGSWLWHSGYFELTLRNSFWTSRFKEILEYLWNKLILRSSSGWEIDSKCVYFLANLALVCEAGPQSVVSLASLSVWVSSLPTGLCLPSLTPGRNDLLRFASSYSLPEPLSRRRRNSQIIKNHVKTNDISNCLRFKPFTQNSILCGIVDRNQQLAAWLLGTCVFLSWAPHSQVNVGEVTKGSVFVKKSHPSSLTSSVSA